MTAVQNEQGVGGPPTYLTGAGPGPDSEDRKLFVGGLSWDTTDEDLFNYFGQFGVISTVSIKFNAVTGNPRGFGFITFASDGSIDAVLEAGPHSLNNKVIDPRKAKTRPNCKKIFVGGLDSNMSEVDIRDYFGRYGMVEGVELPFDRSRNRRREFGFVIFDSEEAADSACTETKQVIGGRDCDIKKAQPQNQIHNQRRFHHQPQVGLGGVGGGGHPHQQHQQQHHHQQQQQQEAQHQQQSFGTNFGWTGGREDYAQQVGVAGMPATSWRDQSRNNGFRTQNSGGGGGGGGHRGYHRGRVYSATTTYGNGAQNYGY